MGLTAKGYGALLRLYQRLPTKARRMVVRTIAPSFTVGSMCIIERPDGDVLLVRQAYRRRWGIPGGLLQRGESAADAACREVREEVNIDVVLIGEPAVVVDPIPQRVDVIFRARPAPGVDYDTVGPASPEIVEARWFSAEELPELQAESVGAFIALARSSRSPQAPPIVSTHHLPRERAS